MYKNVQIKCIKKQTVFRCLDNFVIVVSDDALLVAAKGKIQDVKKVAQVIKRRGKKE